MWIDGRCPWFVGGVNVGRWNGRVGEKTMLFDSLRNDDLISTTKLGHGCQFALAGSSHASDFSQDGGCGMVGKDLVMN